MPNTVQSTADQRRMDTAFSPMRYFHHLHWHPGRKVPKKYRLLVAVVAANDGHVALRGQIDDTEPTLFTCWRSAYGYQVAMPHGSMDAYLRIALSDPRSGLTAHTRHEPCQDSAEGRDTHVPRHG